MKLKLHHQILIAMVIGAGVGLPLNYLAGAGTIDENVPRTLAAYGKGVGDIFLQLLKMIVAPLILTSLVTGVTATGNIKGLGKLGGRTMAYYVASSMIAIITGIIMVNIVRPGEGADLATLEAAASEQVAEAAGPDEAAQGAYYAACLYSIEGRADKALDSLERFILLGEGRQEAVDRVRADGDFEALRGQPRYAAILDGAEKVREDVEAAKRQTVGQTLYKQLFNLIPSNPIAALADPSHTSILGVIFFALLFGIFINVIGGEAGELLTRLFSAAFDVMMRMTMFIIRFAPIGVLGFMLYAAAGKGLDVFIALGWYAVTVALALSFHALITLPLLLMVLARRSPWEFFKQMSPALLTAFSTASSNGTLPLTITCVEERAGIGNRISSFVLPLGATINMDGTALYEAVAVLFIAQAYGHDLGLAEQTIVAITALLASIGAAGIPHAGTVMMVVVLGAVRLPLDAVGLILAVDRILDMYRTSINVWSDSTACAIVNRFESQVVPTGPPGEGSAIEASQS